MRPYELAIVVVERNSRGRVKDKSVQRFTCKEQFEEFKFSIIPQHLSDYEIHEVHLRNAQPPDRPHKSRKDRWCPYCAAWRDYYVEEGYTRCEICGISTRDFYFVKYNKNHNEPVNEPTTRGSNSDLSPEEKRRLRRERRKARKLRQKGGK